MRKIMRLRFSHLSFFALICSNAMLKHDKTISAYFEKSVANFWATLTKIKIGLFSSTS